MICREAESVQGKGDMEFFGKTYENIYRLQTQFGQGSFMILSYKRGVFTLDLDLYMMFQHIKLNALKFQPRLLHVSSVGEGVDQVSHAPAIISRLARHEYN